eukprot:GSChrysophyteH1.ASY1.ANO1.1465.1 assembled CDS
MSETEEETSLAWLGIILVMLGAIGQNLGNNIVSVAHTQEHEHEHEHDLENETGTKGGYKGINADEPEEKADGKANPWSYKDHLWGFGTFIFVASSCMCFIAYGFAAQSLLASLESIQFVSNIAFAKYVLKEEITWAMIISTMLIIAGNALVVIFSGSKTLLLNGEQIFSIYAENTPFHWYLTVALILIVSGEYTWKKYNHARLHLGEKLWNHSFVEPLAFCTSSAIIGAFAVVNAKNLSMMLNSSAGDGRSEFKHEVLYIVAVGWTCIVLFWVYRIDLGLDLFPPLFVIPVIQVCFMLYAIICGGLFFSEFEEFDSSQKIGFAAGVILILFGVYGLAPDSELDFTAGKIEAAAAASAKKSPRRLSFSMGKLHNMDSSKDVSEVSRNRRGSMSHPLAALKTLVSKSERGQTFVAPVVGPVVRTARRLSNFSLGSSFHSLVEHEDENEIEKENDNEAGIVLNARDSTATDLDVDIGQENSASADI